MFDKILNAGYIEMEGWGKLTGVIWKGFQGKEELETTKIINVVREK